MKVVRPKSLTSEKKEELAKYLLNRWEQAKTARKDQVDDAHARWNRNYMGKPLIEKRTLPWAGRSSTNCSGAAVSRVLCVRLFVAGR